MDAIGEVAARVVGFVLRLVAEVLIEIVLARVARFLGWICNCVFQQVCWVLHSDLFAAPFTLLLLLASALAGAIKVVQMLIA
jgi:hypothetical protein